MKKDVSKMVVGVVFLALLVGCIYLNAQVNEKELMIFQLRTEQQAVMLEYDVSIMEVLSGFIDYRQRLDTILVDITIVPEIKRVHIWGWKSTSNLLWAKLDSIRVLYGLRDIVEVEK